MHTDAEGTHQSASEPKQTQGSVPEHQNYMDNDLTKKNTKPGYDPDFDGPFDEDAAFAGDKYSTENFADDDFSGDGPDLNELENGSSESKPEFEDLDLEDEPKQTKKTRELNTADTAADPRAVADEKAKKKKSRTRKIVGAVILEIVTLACIFGYGYFLRAWNLISRPEVNEKNIENNNISLEKKQEMEQGYWTFAVFGVDGRSASDLVSKGLNSDVIIIVNINQDTGEIRLCSVYRDTYLNISDKDSYRKINAAYCNGGPEQALAALNKNLDLNIKNYVTFNWKAVADGINILGGIDGIDISKAEFYYINAFITETVEVTNIGSHHLTSPGVQHLDGVQAVAYGRLRLMDSDFARTERQKKVIKACFEKAKNSSFSVLNNIMVVCFPEVATNIGFNDIVAMAQNISKYYISESGGFPWQRSASAVSSVGDVVVPATLESNVRLLHAFLFDDEDYQPSNAVLKYSETIKEKTGIYKEGQVVESVRTDGGLISTPKTSAAETDGGEESETAESETDENGNVIERATIGIDENGNYIYPRDPEGNVVLPTDADGNVQYPTDEYGNIVYETDADGNVVNPTNADGTPLTVGETRPTELEENGASTPGESSHADDVREEDGPGAQSSKQKTSEEAAGPGGTAAATTEAYGPGNLAPATTESSSLESTSSGSSTPGGSTPGTTGSNTPGENSSGTSDSSASVGPGSTGGPGSETSASGSLTPGGTSDTGGPGSSSGTNAPGSTASSSDVPGSPAGAYGPGSTP